MSSASTRSSFDPGRLIAERAFVVQLSGEHAPERSQDLSGRAENVATGEHVDFDSVQELEAFLRRAGRGADN
jgi:hypothetical protein